MTMTHDAIHAAIMHGQAVGAGYRLAPPHQSPRGMVGTQLGRQAGSSLEFREHRDYHPGDDLRHIDWAAYARSDRLNVKLYREEVSPHLDLIVDASASMALADSAKAAATFGLAAALASAASSSGYSQRTFCMGERVMPMPGGVAPDAWRPPEMTAAPDIEAWHAAGPMMRSQSIRIVISDLLLDVDPVPWLGAVSHNAAGLWVVQMLAEADAEPPQRGSLRLVDSETGELREVFVDAAMQQRYRENLARHQQMWVEACRHAGAAMVTLIAERFVSAWPMLPLVEAGLLQV
jgi:uncharacterized protein (DUF58 family)